MLTYKLYPYENSATKLKGYIARAVITETVDLDKLSEHMNKHNTPFSKGTIKGILTDMVSCIIELGLEGKAVKIPDLGIFSIGLQSKVVKDIKDWSVATGISGVKLNCRATGDARPILLNAQTELKEADDYKTPKPKSTEGGTGPETLDSGKEDTKGSETGDNTGGAGYEVIDEDDDKGNTEP